MPETKGFAGYHAGETNHNVVAVLHVPEFRSPPRFVARRQPTISNDPLAVAVALPLVLGEVFPRSKPATRAALTSVAAIRTFRPGEAILEQGDETSVALILDGHVALRRTTPEGRQLIVRIVDRGKLPAVLPLVARPSSADVVALTLTPVAMWRGDDVRSIAAADAGLAVDLAEHVLAAYEEVTLRLEGLLSQDALRRVARVLHQHADLFFADEPVLTRRHLPMMVGTSREMTGRVLRVLESRRIVVRVDRSQLRLLDRAGLAAVAQRREEPPRAAGRPAP